MKIGMACDHGAYTYKEEIKQMLIDEGHEVVDCGCHDTNSVDYPDMAKACADLVVNKEVDKGIVMCGTGIGISIAANMLSMGQRTTGIETCKDIVHTFLNTPFSEGERHKGRIAKISAIEDAQ